MARIEITGLTKQFGSQHIIKGVDLTIHEGEFMVFVGPSGCGKSTMLRMLAGLEQPTSGDICFDGQRVNDVLASERGAAMVFQSYALYPHMTVAENMAFGLRMTGRPKAEREALVKQTAEKLQLTDWLQRLPKQLSGGQRQRVAIGRAIVRRPKVFLFDEPLSNLDAALRVQMRIELARLHAELGTTMVYVTHDQTEAMTLGHRIAVFHQGRIEQVGAPMDLYRAPVNRFVAEFLGSPKINVIPYQWSAQGQTLKMGDQSMALPADQAHLAAWLKRGSALGVRPEAFAWSGQGHGLQGTVEFTENLGDVQLVHLRCPGLQELVRVKTSQPGDWRAQTPVCFNIQLETSQVFDENGLNLRAH
jgi:multiple sugar transport system ATP-binding protein